MDFKLKDLTPPPTSGSNSISLSVVSTYVPLLLNFLSKNSEKTYSSSDLMESLKVDISRNYFTRLLKYLNDNSVIRAVGEGSKREYGLKYDFKTSPVTQTIAEVTGITKEKNENLIRLVCRQIIVSYFNTSSFDDYFKISHIKALTEIPYLGSRKEFSSTHSNVCTVGTRLGILDRVGNGKYEFGNTSLPLLTFYDINLQEGVEYQEKLVSAFTSYVLQALDKNQGVYYPVRAVIEVLLFLMYYPYAITQNIMGSFDSTHNVHLWKVLRDFDIVEGYESNLYGLKREYRVSNLEFVYTNTIPHHHKRIFQDYLKFLGTVLVGAIDSIQFLVEIFMEDFINSKSLGKVEVRWKHGKHYPLLCFNTLDEYLVIASEKGYLTSVDGGFQVDWNGNKKFIPTVLKEVELEFEEVIEPTVEVTESTQEVEEETIETISVEEFAENLTRVANDISEQITRKIQFELDSTQESIEIKIDETVEKYLSPILAELRELRQVITENKEMKDTIEKFLQIENERNKTIESLKRLI